MFLFGMNIMGENLRRMSGGKPQGWLGRLCKTPLRGVALGALVTALVQSSSATTVMVVGFVNSGIMTLSQSVGVIMGANLGTTFTSWLLSLTQLGGGGVLGLLSPTAFAPLLAAVGTVLVMNPRSDRRRDLGYAFLGFTVLIFGMELMSGTVKPLAAVPEFTRILTVFGNPVAGIAAGALLTAVIQSSSASVGILQALAASGVLTRGAALPIILGQNIGTCVTTLLSGLGAFATFRGFFGIPRRACRRIFDSGDAHSLQCLFDADTAAVPAFARKACRADGPGRREEKENKKGAAGRRRADAGTSARRVFDTRRALSFRTRVCVFDDKGGFSAYA